METRNRELQQLTLWRRASSYQGPERARPERVGQTRISYIRTGQILTRATGFISSYDYTLNPYGGCSFGCGYCYAAFFSQNDDDQESWGQWVNAKENAASLLTAESGKLRDKRVYASTVTDPYQPVERQLDLTGQLLDVLKEARVRLVVQTRSPLVTRDIERLKAIERGGGRVQVNMTVTTDDEEIRLAFEGGCPSNKARLKAIAQVAEAGVQTAITVTPALPVIDAEGFAKSLEEARPGYVISQPFHDAGRQKFAAGTRQGAIEILQAKLGVDAQAVDQAYQAHYRKIRRALLDQLGNRVREGRSGFRPPF